MLPRKLKLPLVAHLDRQQPGQVDLGDSFGHGLVLHAATFRLHFVDVVGRPHQVEGVVLLQQRVLCWHHAEGGRVRETLTENLRLP